MFYTIDPSDHVDGNADDYDERALRERFATVRDSVGWVDSYLNRRIALRTGRSYYINDELKNLSKECYRDQKWTILCHR